MPFRFAKPKKFEAGTHTGALRRAARASGKSDAAYKEFEPNSPPRKKAFTTMASNQKNASR